MPPTADPAVTPLEACLEQRLHPDAVDLAIANCPPPEQLDKVSRLFKLLGDPTRARLLYALAAAQELCVCDLAAACQASPTTISQALRLLRAAGVVTGRRAGRNIYYRLCDSHVSALLDITREHIAHEHSPDAGEPADPLATAAQHSPAIAAGTS